VHLQATDPESGGLACLQQPRRPAKAGEAAPSAGEIPEPLLSMHAEGRRLSSHLASLSWVQMQPLSVPVLSELSGPPKVGGTETHFEARPQCRLGSSFCLVRWN